MSAPVTTPAVPATGEPNPSGATPPNGPPATGEPLLGPNGEKALESERSLRADAEKRAKAAEAELDKVRNASKTEQEKALDAARNEGKAEVQSAANARLIRAEVRAAAATAGFQDPRDAVAQLGEKFGGVKVTDTGDVDETMVKAMVEELAKAKPYLLRASGTPTFAPNPGQGHHQPVPASGREAGLAEARKRFPKPA